ncbi:GGDEF domain-containing response regulator [Arenimonas alkanexedens]
MSGDTSAKARILVVDDSKLMRKAAHKMLGDEFDVVTADDGEQAWTMVGEDQTIQVVFSDLNMPVADGYELLRRVRASDDPGVQSLPLIIVTGAENDEAARLRALEMGATDFITKPFSTIDLVARARAHASNQRITRQLQAQSTLDGLTGLSNKAGFVDRLQQDIAYARRHQQPLCLVRLEMTDFRRVFLYYGREAAEGLVLQVARLLRARIRKEDTAARIGLGGFALSLPGGDPAGIEGMIGRLRLELAGQPPMDENGEPISVELGSAVLCPDLTLGQDAPTVLEQCQQLLEAAPVPVATGAAGQAPVVHVETSIVPLAAPAATPASVTPALRAPAMPAEAVEVPIRIDPLLDQLAVGNTGAVTGKMPQIIGRLLPILRLLGPGQRAQLIEFLQRLG